MQRNVQGKGRASTSAPSPAGSANHQGGTGKASTAKGHPAMVCTTASHQAQASAASCHKGSSSTPAKASGVITKVTQGTANRLASKPTTDN